MSKPLRFDSRVAVVTGAGNGLGRLYALDLAARGVAVVVNDVDPAAAERVADEIRVGGGKAVPDENSVASPAGGRAIVRTAVDQFARLDIVVANAGLARRGSFESLSVDDIRLLLEVNLEGAIWLTQAAVPLLKEQQHGRIVLVTSAAGIYGHGHGANYCASKAGVVGLLRALAIECAWDGICVNAISPFAYTGMTLDTPGLTEDVAARLDARRVSPVVVYLASDDCDLNGQVLSVAGGTVARVFSATTQGWRAGPGTALAAESVRDHLDEIVDPTGAVVPGKVKDEVGHLLGPGGPMRDRPIRLSGASQGG